MNADDKPEMDDNLLWDVSQVIATIKLDNRITKLRTAVGLVANRKGWSDERVEEVMEATRNVIKHHQKHILRTLRNRHNALAAKQRRM